MQLIVALVDIDAFPVSAVVKGDLLRVSQQLRVDGTVLTFKLLLDGCQSAEGGRNVLNDDS